MPYDVESIGAPLQGNDLDQMLMLPRATEASCRGAGASETARFGETSTHQNLADAANRLQSRSSANRGGLAPWQVRAIDAFIVQNLDQKILLEHLAAEAHLSVSHFAAAFKKTFGEPPHAYLIKHRLDQAQQMMLSTGEPLSQIALACGLGEQAHFSTMFRQKTGFTPNNWRRLRRLECQSRASQNRSILAITTQGPAFHSSR